MLGKLNERISSEINLYNICYLSSCQRSPLETGQIYQFRVANKELAGMLVDGAALHYIPQQGNLIQGKSRLALKNWKNQLEKTA